ncbi:hypothetical protein J3R30DRAFT_3767145 [Lentinula aciculospora]|uniref:TPX2 C-terminal domain-containing protein n=1 Tax=Lentinula aciculospora TaxID=153920 RepID=A0A9W8ZRG8_9AGAR|nr:hypothetical protein J3R30DRAFT_3767145 [Lentinula aciculospora]
MQNISGNDLSLRHLPDLSNSSFSFELPPGSNQDLLLNNDDDFLGVGSDSFATPAPSRFSRPPLTLEHLTPKVFTRRTVDGRNRLPAVEKTILGLSSHSNSVRHPSLTEAYDRTGTKSNMIPKFSTGVALRNETLSTPQRMQRLRDEIQGLAQSTYPSTSAVTSPTLSDSIEEDFPLEDPVSPNLILHSQINEASLCSSESEITSSTIGGGLAERLVVYSQNLVGSHERPVGNDDSVTSAFTVFPNHQEQSSSRVADDSYNTSETTVDIPLTVSQLSPLKITSHSSLDSPPSPMRKSHKRQGSPIPHAQPINREKPSAVTSSSHAVLLGRRNVLKKRPPLSANSSSTSGGVKSKPLLRTSITSQPVSKANSFLGNRVASSAQRGHFSGSSSGRSITSNGTSKLNLERSGGSVQTFRNKPTRPVGFNFQSDRRIEARQTDSTIRNQEEQPRKRQKLHTAYAIPDFKASHSVQDALLTSIKGQIKPVVPLQVEMHTDARARERGKFNDQLREKELQARRAHEERKRQQAKDEERELKEQRKKAIPKANLVPDWYKDAPRRKERPDSRSEGDS